MGTSFGAYELNDESAIADNHGSVLEYVIPVVYQSNSIPVFSLQYLIIKNV